MINPENKELHRTEILQSVASVPPLPAAAARVLELAQQPDVGIGEIMAVMETDPGLTGEALRLSNSAYFAGPRQIASLRDAGVLFGARRIVQLVLAATIFPLARKPIAGYGLPGGALLDHLISVAVGTEEVAKALNIAPPNYAFTAGMLHDIGRIIMGDFVARCSAEIQDCALVEGMTYNQAENYVLGIDRAEAGAALLSTWNIPEPVVNAVRWHLQPEQITGTTADTLVVDLVHAARLISVQCGIGLGLDGLHYTASETSIARLGLTPEIEDRAASNMLQAFNEIRAMLQQ